MSEQQRQEDAASRQDVRPSSPMIQRVRLGRPRWFVLVWLGMALALAVLASLLWLVGRWNQPYGSGERLVEIPRGYSLQRIAQRLEDEQVISSAWLFRLYVHMRSSASQLQAGEYLFEQPLSMAQAAEMVARGDIHYHKAVVREGLDLEEIADHLSSQGWGERQRLLQLMRDPSWIADLDPQAQDLEGYVFPDTYLFPRSAQAAQVLRNMVERTRHIWDQRRQAQANELGMSLRQVLTLASLIEKEAARADERRLISSVFHNRLRQNIKLDCDPTVIYAVKRQGEYDGIIHRSDLQIDSPYNTYRYPGLPPGPIANAGLGSIDAALDPASTEFLFFVARNDGSHVFSRTYREHERAVQRFQRD
ncbi:MAG TPA: endolytic transglycosylase MltG [Acidobacteriota bacterium]|nr:endolytic transglycosylase MltG [Acidobacteriota bacterium]